MSGSVKYAETRGHEQLLSGLNRLAELPESSLNSLALSISELIRSELGLVLSAILLKPKDLNQLNLAGYSSKKPLHIVRPLHLKLDRDWFYNQTNNHLLLGDDMDAEAVAQYLNWSVNQLEHNDQLLGLESVYVTKLVSRGHNIGVLAIGWNSKVSIDHPDIEAIESVKGIVSTLITSLINEQENHYATRKLKDYTEKLSILDEAKDDFISMASHQLRTPLTSVKGYISMILEGDAGRINDDEKTMLTQAFASCQRMVYIISDLLNVSRLNAGKFVMDLSPVNLDLVIKDEIDQLKEIAKARDVTINYSPNPDTPELELDETKIRQVLMNFIDNALYYTAPGGQISISLDNKPSSIEIRVKDNGMGVPRSEQRHLFTKFYRASNARKARPDGTGLGLFMAKKVVIGLGGAIIFESVEGKGSTFGFMFPKDS